jgi:hypothetical protein
MTDELAERMRKIGGATLRSIGHISKLQRMTDMTRGPYTAPGLSRKSEICWTVPLIGGLSELLCGRRRGVGELRHIPALNAGDGELVWLGWCGPPIPVKVPSGWIIV